MLAFNRARKAKATKIRSQEEPAIPAPAKTRNMPVVVLTSSDEEKDIKGSYDLGVNSYVRKPVQFTEFAEAVKQMGLYWLILNVPPTGRRQEK